MYLFLFVVLFKEYGSQHFYDNADQRNIVLVSFGKLTVLKNMLINLLFCIGRISLLDIKSIFCCKTITLFQFDIAFNDI